MKEGFDREIDSLLRRRARGTAELRPWGDGAGDGFSSAHLDADELGAFAEGALPPSARLSAASHLADCERCRGVVVGLARVADVGAEVKPEALAATPARPSAWRAFISSLLAPRVLRYATPVLALSLVAVVSYIALRSDKGNALRAAREGRDQPNVAMSEPAPAQATASNANANTAGLVAQGNNNAASSEAQGTAAPVVQDKGHGNADARPAEADSKKEEAQPSTATQPPPPPSAPATTTEGPAELSKAAPSAGKDAEDETARSGYRERAETRDKSARTAEPVDDAASNDAISQQQRASRSRANEVQMPDGGARNQQKRADNNTSNVYGGSGGGANVGAAAPPKESERGASRTDAPGRSRPARPAERKADEDDSGAQMRTAAGHRFRREGSAWVDVNYKSSMSSTGVRRGTEPFRALVADVPVVGRVAEVLSGEVIVVVSGRAYRIY